MANNDLKDIIEKNKDAFLKIDDKLSLFKTEFQDNVKAAVCSDSLIKYFKEDKKVFKQIQFYGFNDIKEEKKKQIKNDYHKKGCSVSFRKRVTQYLDVVYFAKLILNSPKEIELIPGCIDTIKAIHIMPYRITNEVVANAVKPMQAFCDCYTVVIKGEVKYLFFEKANAHHVSRFGRWFVECPTMYFSGVIAVNKVWSDGKLSSFSDKQVLKCFEKTGA